MPQYKAPGVYVEEMGGGPPPIVKAPTHEAGFLGPAERGPIASRRVKSMAEYRRWFGDREGLMADAARLFFENGGQRLHVARMVPAPSAVAERLFGGVTVRAIGPGAWGNQLFAALRSDRPGGFRLQVAVWDGAPAGLQGFDPFDEPRGGPRPTLMEDFALSGAAGSWAEQVAGQSSLVTLAEGADPPVAGGGLLSGGLDGAGPLTAADFGAALAGLSDDDISLVYAPGVVAADVVDAIASHCEAARFRFAIFDSGPDLTQASLTALDPRTQIRDTAHGAYYAPWVRIAGARGPRLAPPGGAVAGIYARTDIERGVHKAPANEVVRGVTGLQFEANTATQEVLTPRGVNLIRRLEGRGTRLWGARTLSSDPERKYVNVQRLLFFLEHSIERGLGWAVFEPNAEPLWARVRDVVGLFLREQWRGGAFMGQTERETFFVRCDRTTMTAGDLLTGRLVCQIGVAVVKPAEFMILRIQVGAGPGA